MSKRYRFIFIGARYACLRCGAMVLWKDLDLHDDWHDQLAAGQGDDRA